MTDPDVYMCGPPPMLEALEALLTGRGVDPGRIFQDRFTASADAADPEAPEAAGVRSAGTASEREFAWFKPAARRATLYEDVTVDTQPSIHRHLTRGWPLHFEDGRGIWSDASTALSSTDWFAFRDPGEQWERTYCQAGTAAEQQIEGALRSAAEQGLLADLRPEWTAFLHDTLQIPAFVEHGLWFALATAARDCLSDSVATCVRLQAAIKQRSAQAIVLYAMDLETSLGEPFAIETARTAFLREPAWQPTRRYLERLAATPDWAEVLFAANLCFEPTVATLLRRELGTRAAAAHGDTVTPVLARAETQEWERARTWTIALARFLLADPLHGEHNRTVLTGWVSDWLPQALGAAAGLVPLAATLGLDTALATDRMRDYAGAMLAESGLPELCALVGFEPPPELVAERPRPSSHVASGRPGRSVLARQTSKTTEPSDGFDFVGIVMAKSAEGDAVAEWLGRRDGVEVREQAAFWDIRARDRLTIPYAEIGGARLRDRRVFDPA